MAWAAGIDLLAALAVKTLPPLPVHTLPLLRSTRRGECGCWNASTVDNCCFPGLHLAMYANLFCPKSNSAGAADPLPQAEASPNDIEGGKMFATTCGFCHQDGGRHAGRGPKLSKSERSDEYIVERIKKGKVGAMPAYGSVFSDGQIIAILAYIRGLDD